MGPKKEVQAVEEMSAASAPASAPGITRDAPMRRGSQETPYRYARRGSALAPYPWERGAVSTAPANVLLQIHEARAALRFLKEVEQDVFVQALREELSNSNVCYFQHCFATLWDDSQSESSDSDLDVPVFVSRAADDPPAAPEAQPASPAAVPVHAPPTAQVVPDSPAAVPADVPPTAQVVPATVISSEDEPAPEHPRPRGPGDVPPSLMEQLALAGTVWEWPSNPYSEEWRGHPDLVDLRFPQNRTLPASLPSMGTWPYYRNQHRLPKYPNLHGSLECQRPCPVCRNVCGREEQPFRRKCHSHHECDRCHRRGDPAHPRPNARGRIREGR